MSRLFSVKYADALVYRTADQAVLCLIPPRLYDAYISVVSFSFCYEPEINKSMRPGLCFLRVFLTWLCTYCAKILRGIRMTILPFLKQRVN
jgi:hypothetical protein